MQMRVAAKEAAALQLHSNTQVEALRASSAAAQQELAIQRTRARRLGARVDEATKLVGNAGDGPEECKTRTKGSCSYPSEAI